jgi:hypothetical protein
MHRGDDRYEWLPPNTVTSISVMKMYTSTTHCTIEYTFQISKRRLAADPFCRRARPQDWRSYHILRGPWCGVHHVTCRTSLSIHRRQISQMLIGHFRSVATAIMYYMHTATRSPHMHVSFRHRDHVRAYT